MAADAQESKLLEGENHIKAPIKAIEVERVEFHMANRLSKVEETKVPPNALKLKLEERRQKRKAYKGKIKLERLSPTRLATAVRFEDKKFPNAPLKKK